MQKTTTLILIIFSTCLYSADWPQFRGPFRNGISLESGLLQQWPEDGPRLLWSVENLGSGYGSAAIAKGSVYIIGEEKGVETLFAFNLQGRLRWKTALSGQWDRSYPGPRTTPTVDDDRVYAITGMGEIACVNAKDGKIRWRLQAMEKFGGKYHKWGISESPLIVDDKVIVTPGGALATMAALDKMSGRIIWTTKIEEETANYCSPILVERGGRKIIVTMLQHYLVGVDALDGKLLWKDAFSAYQDSPKDINPVSPVYVDGLLYATSGYDDGGALYEISPDGLTLKRLWTDKTLDVHIGGVVVVNGVIYGASWEGNTNGKWIALDLKSGKVLWEHHWINKGSIIFADGMLYLYTEKEGRVGLVRPNPKQFELISSFAITAGSGQHWAHPSLADGRLYIRRGNALLVYDVCTSLCSATKNERLE
ncbi:MAG: PQQ-binding-like beta-propeller repeat protein [candidate division KSB1 bacterium]|nr:PQQ-binding-like beta-propeller repeat protein [candidate division KSB1 bacterium]